MKYYLVLFYCFLIFSTFVIAQKPTKKLILITLDGYRWQELFGGADSLLINDKNYVNSDIDTLKKWFWHSNLKERRKLLMPFVWTTIAEKGVFLGNRYDSSVVELTNTMHFSYPGYNEILTGTADDKRIFSNDKIYNPNISIFEIANNMPIYQGKVLVFGSWELYPFILNVSRSKIPVNAGYMHALTSTPSSQELLLNKLQDQTPQPWYHERYDIFTHEYALQALKTKKPSLVYIAYGETDEFAHAGKYDEYLRAARRTDDFIRELWDYIQTDSFYKGQTSFIITTDHGRGNEQYGKGNHSWRDHGSNVIGAHETWIMALGNEFMKPHSFMPMPYYTNQVAATIAHIMHIPYTKAMGEPLYNILILK